MFILWNPINVIDGEAHWFLVFLTILSIAALTTHFWRWFCTRLVQKFQNSDELLKSAAINASFSPIVFYIWFVAFIQAIDLISDHFFSHSLAYEIKLLYSSSAVLTFGWFLFRLKNNVAGVLLEKSKAKEIGLEPGKVYGMQKLFSVLIVIIVLLVLLEVTGVSLNALIAFGGISGLALAFASQEIIANFFGGIMIHIVQPFAIGDSIVLPNSSIEGIVEEIGWYETRLRSKEMQPIYIPNSLFSKAFVVNNGRRSHRRILEKISIRHEDLPKSAAIVADIKKFLIEYESIDSAKRMYVHIDQIASYSLDIGLSALTTSVDETEYYAVRDVVLAKACEIIRSHKAEIAIPRETIVPYDKV